MSLSKRRIEAEEADVNQEIRLCAACGDRIEWEWDDDVLSTRIEHSIIGPFTTVWHCGCKPIHTRRCVKCSRPANTSEVPICIECLQAYEEMISTYCRLEEALRVALPQLLREMSQDGQDGAAAARPAAEAPLPRPIFDA